MHQFSQENASDNIRHWLLNDIKYRKELMDAMTIFINYSLSGKIMWITSTDDTKGMTESDLSLFMEQNSIGLLFDDLRISKWITI